MSDTNPDENCHSKEFLNNIHVRLGDMEKSYTVIRDLVAMREERSKDIHKKVDEIYVALLGDFKRQEPGLITRIDRIEQSEEHKKWVYLGLITLGLNAIWEWVKGVGGHGGN